MSSERKRTTRGFHLSRLVSPAQKDCNRAVLVGKLAQSGKEKILFQSWAGFQQTTGIDWRTWVVFIRHKCLSAHHGVEIADWAHQWRYQPLAALGVVAPAIARLSFACGWPCCDVPLLLQVLLSGSRVAR
jgi:hypothetical protein